MAILTLTNASVVINSVDLSDHVRQVTVDYNADMQDSAHMGDDTHESLAGLKNWKIDVEFNQDFAAAKVDATLFPLVGAAAFTIEVRPVNSARSATNPGYNATAVLASYPPLGNAVGQLATTKASFQPGGASPTLLRSVS